MERVVRGQELKSGISTSCGCSRGATYTLEGQSKGGARPPEYSTWMAMKARCNYPGHTNYDRYGGRGIKVCERWNKSFADFLADMGPAPEGKKTIERKDKDGNYEPGNCVWASRKEQAQNRHACPPTSHIRPRDGSGRFARPEDAVIPPC